MGDIAQNTLYLTTPGTYVARDHLTLQVKVPLGPDGTPATAEDLKAEISNFKSLSIPIHHLESICIFGASTISPPALDLCWEHGVAVNYLSQFGYLQARLPLSIASLPLRFDRGEGRGEVSNREYQPPHFPSLLC